MKKLIILFILLTMPLLAQDISSDNSEKNIDREFYNAEKLFFQKKYNFAREAFLLYLKRRPLSTNDMLYYYIGACYFQDKQYDKAIEYYKLAFDINDSYSYCNNIANSYYQLKNYDDALVWYNNSIERLQSPYTIELNYEILTNYTISQNVVTNTIFNVKYISDNYITNSSTITTTDELSSNEIDSDTNYVHNNEIIKFDNTFTELPLFTNIIITNTYTN